MTPVPIGQPWCHVRIVPHRRTVALVIANRAPDGLPLGRRPAGILRLLFQGGADGICLPGHEWLRIVTHPNRAVGMGFPQRGIGCVPQIRGGVEDIQYQGMLW